MAGARPKIVFIESDDTIRISGSQERLPLFFILILLVAGAGLFVLVASASDFMRFSEISLRAQIRAVLAAIVGPLLLALGLLGAWQMARRRQPPMLTIDNAGIADTWLPDGPIRWSEIEKIERQKQGGVTSLAVRLTKHAWRLRKLPLWRRILAYTPGKAPTILLPSSNSALCGVSTHYIMWLIGQRQRRLVSIPSEFDPWEHDIRLRSPEHIAASILHIDPTVANALVRGRQEKAQADKDEALAIRWQAVAECLSRTTLGENV